MSFFDEVETTVANASFLRATEMKEAVVLPFKSFNELSDLDETLHTSLTITDLLQPESIARYQFKLWLNETSKTEENIEKRTTLLNELDSFRLLEKNSQDRRNKAVEVFALLTSYFAVDNVPLLILDDDKSDYGTKVEIITPKLNETKETTIEEVQASAQVDTKETKTETELKSSSPQTQEAEEKDTAAAEKVVQAVDNEDQSTPVNVLKKLYDTYIADHCFVEFFDPILVCLEASYADLLPRFIDSEHYKRFVQAKAYAKEPVTFAHFQFFRVLGKGAFGSVSVAQKIDTHKIFAIKEMSKKKVKKDDSAWMVVNEKKMLSKTHSPFVLGLQYCFHTIDSLFLVFDMCAGGDLKFHLRMENRTRPFPNARACFHAAEVLLGLEHLHSMNIVYRDLKPDNILLSEDGHCMISDLGLTIQLKKGKTLKHLAGTPAYWAPEILEKSGTYTQSDYWSFGVLLFEMLTGKRPPCLCDKKTKQWCPFGRSNHEENAQSGEGELKLDVPYSSPYLTEEAISLLKQLFEVDPSKRLGAGGAHEIKSHPYFASIDWVKLAHKTLTPPFVPEEKTVHAASIADVGEFNNAEFRGIKITGKDNERWDKEFVYVSPECAEKEISRALYASDNPPEQDPVEVKKSGPCCVVS